MTRFRTPAITMMALVLTGCAPLPCWEETTGTDPKAPLVFWQARECPVPAGTIRDRDHTPRTAPEEPEPPAEEPETGGDTGTPDGGEAETPEEPATEPDRETDPKGWQDWKDRQNPGNGKEVGNAPFDGERGEEPSGRG